MKKSLNLNLIKEEHSENDYLVCWSEFGTRPNKLNLYDLYDIDSFIDYLNESEKTSFGIFTDILPSGEDFIVNEKNLIKVSENVFISFIYHNKLSEEAVVGEVTIFYNNQAQDEVNKILNDLNQISIRMDDQNSNYRVKILSLGQSGLEVEPLELMKFDSENIESYYNDRTFKKAEKLIKKIKKNDKGLIMFHGERGCGKTSLVNWIISSIDKGVIYIPCSLIEATITPDFRNFLKRFKNSVLVFDDMDVFFNDLNSKMNLLSNNIIQLVDGFQSDDLNLNVICIFNQPSENDLDENLLDCNNLIDVVEVGRLSEDKCKEVSKILSLKTKFDKPMRIVDVIRDKDSKKINNPIGY